MEDVRFIGAFGLKVFSPVCSQAAGAHAERRVTGFNIPSSQHQTGESSAPLFCLWSSHGLVFCSYFLLAAQQESLISMITIDSSQNVVPVPESDSEQQILAHR